MNIEKHIKHSKRVETTDLDWQLAASIGLTSHEAHVLTYMADIEGQTFFYLKELLQTGAASDPKMVAFLTIWNYEEFFHSEAIACLLEACGHGLAAERKKEVRASAQLAAKLEEIAQTFLARMFPRQFPALYMAWGASQELLTLRGYEQLAATTKNPVVAELCQRIAKQERMHFAFYFNAARARLAPSRLAQRLTRWVFERFWTPVGAGVKSSKEVMALCTSLFPGDSFGSVAKDIDDRLGTLPGFEGFEVVRRYARRLAPVPC